MFLSAISASTAPVPNNQEVHAEPMPIVAEVEEQPKVKTERTVKPKKAKPKPPVEKVTAVAPPPVATPPAISRSSTELMQLAGIPEADRSAVDFIISHESGWNHLVWNGAGSGAYGLCQSLPATKMSSAGADYMTNPVTQLKWCHSYALGRYGSWQSAQAFWIANSWW